MTFDILIRNGTVLDGVGKEGQLADVGISGEKIAAVGQLGAARGNRVIDATGKYVSPGFIDVQNHSDAYFTLLDIPTAPSLVTQGISTILVGHCGSSLAPLPTPEAIASVQKWHSLAGTNLNWLTFEEFFEVLSNYPLGVNVASLVGHSTLRRGLIGDQVRPATREEIKIIDKLLRDSLQAGAAGVSLGLAYAHETNAAAAELQKAAQTVREHDKLLSVHLRSESAHVVNAVNEVVQLARDTGVTLKISHFKIRGKRNWSHLEELLSVLDRAYQQGAKLFFDVYPYSTSWTVLYTYLPRWAYEGGRRAMLQTINVAADRQKVTAYLKGLEQDLGGVFIATSETNPGIVGKTLAQVAANQEITVEEALLNAVTATETQVVVFDRNLSDDGLETLLKHPLSVVASDGAGYDFHYSPMHGLVHPRCFGTYPKFLSMVREKKLMSWAEAIKKITSRPAERAGLKDRGRLAEGAMADVVVFDPREIGSRATYENPYQQADGIEYVLINGKVAYASREPVEERPGRVLRL